MLLPCASHGPDTVPKSPIQPSQRQIWTKRVFENDLEYMKPLIQRGHLSFFKYFTRAEQLLCPDLVKLVHS